MVDKLSDNIDFWILFLDDIVLENSLGIQQVLLVVDVLLGLLLFLYTVTLSFLLLANVRSQNYNLFCLHNVDPVV